jgi:hypothetical protein
MDITYFREEAYNGRRERLSTGKSEENKSDISWFYDISGIRAGALDAQLGHP